MLTNVRYILITAVRDRLFVWLCFSIILAIYISYAMGGTALLEPEQMTIAFSAAASRVILVIGLIVFVCFHVKHAFDSKEIDVLLSRPISRSNLVISYWLGFASVATLLLFPVIILLYIVGVLSQTGFWAWSLSLLLEIWLVIAVSLFASLTLKSAVGSVLAGFGFYTLSRMMGFFLATAESGVLFSHSELNQTIRFIIDAISLLIPRLDFFAKSDWLIHSIRGIEDVYLFGAQALIFIPLLVLASIIDFKRKQF